MKTGIKDINGVEICVGDKVVRANRLDRSTIWTVEFKPFKILIGSVFKTIYTFVLVDSEGYEQEMETEIIWQYSDNDITEYRIVK